MEIGAVLRQARKAKALTLEEVSRTTKIQRRYLDALENEQYAILPEKIYVRYYLNTYARFLGLNAAELLQAFDRNYRPQANNETQKPAERVLSRKTAGRTRKVAFRTRLASSRDAYLMANVRNTMAAKKKPPWWMQPVNRLKTMVRSRSAAKDGRENLNRNEI
jgi:transcriptional regulator with XRE-family HTH domain